MFWIKYLNYNDAGPLLKKIYDRINGPHQQIDNILITNKNNNHY